MKTVAHIQKNEQPHTYHRNEAGTRPRTMIVHPHRSTRPQWAHYAVYGQCFRFDDEVETISLSQYFTLNVWFLLPPNMLTCLLPCGKSTRKPSLDKWVQGVQGGPKRPPKLVDCIFFVLRLKSGSERLPRTRSKTMAIASAQRSARARMLGLMAVCMSSHIDAFSGALPLAHNLGLHRRSRPIELNMITPADIVAFSKVCFWKIHWHWKRSHMVYSCRLLIRFILVSTLTNLCMRFMHLCAWNIMHTLCRPGIHSNDTHVHTQGTCCSGSIRCNGCWHAGSIKNRRFSAQNSQCLSGCGSWGLATRWDRRWECRAAIDTNMQIGWVRAEC